jgi:hypothetical protein
MEHPEEQLYARYILPSEHNIFGNREWMEPTMVGLIVYQGLGLS